MNDGRLHHAGGAATSLIVALGALLIAGLAACANGPRRDAPKVDAAVYGARLFRVSCAGCHGADARGNGPIAPLLKVPVADLTLIAARRGGTFPDDEIYGIVDGQADLSAHGPRHMPVWGYEFFGDDEDDEAAHRQASTKIDQLVQYLRSVQRAN